MAEPFRGQMTTGCMMNVMRTPSTGRHARIRLPGYDYASAEDVISVTICSRDRRDALVTPHLPDRTVDSLQWTRRVCGVRVYAYCMMPDHLHLVVQLGPSGPPLGSIIGRFKSFTDREYRALRPGAGPLWQRRFYDHIVRERDGEFSAIEYVLHNPVRKGLVLAGDEWPWGGRLDLFEGEGAGSATEG